MSTPIKFERLPLHGFEAAFLKPPTPIEQLLFKFISTREQNLQALFTRGIDVLAHLDVREVSFTSNAAPNTQDTVAHDLDRVPRGFIVVDKNKAGDVYRSATFDATSLYLKTTVASVALKLLIY